MKKEIVPHELEFLLRFPAVMNVTSPVDFLNNLCWGGIKVRDWLITITLVTSFTGSYTEGWC